MNNKTHIFIAFSVLLLILLTLTFSAMVYIQRDSKQAFPQEHISIPPPISEEYLQEAEEQRKERETVILSEDGKWRLYRHYGNGTPFTTWYPADWRATSRDNATGSSVAFIPPGRMPGSDSGVFLTVRTQSLSEFHAQQEGKGVSMIPITINNADGLLTEGSAFSALYESGIVLGDSSNTYIFTEIKSDEATDFVHDYQPILDFIIASFRFVN